MTHNNHKERVKISDKMPNKDQNVQGRHLEGHKLGQSNERIPGWVVTKEWR